MFLRKKRSFFSVSSSEEQRGQAEGPDQRRNMSDETCIIRHEVIRLLILAISFLALLLTFLSFLFVHTIVPLFVSIVLIPIVYGYLDWHFYISEHSPPVSSSKK